MRRVSSRRLALLLAFVCAAGLFWWATQIEQPEPPSPPAEPRRPPPEPEPPRVEPLAVAMPSVEPIDAGPLDAGAAPPVAVRAEPDVEAYMRKWRDALAPLLKRMPMAPIAIVSEADKPDGGVDAGCEPGVRSFPLNRSDRVDYLVVVDTSGSMVPAGLRAASDWIGQLEFTLASAGSEYRLLVLAEPSWLQLGDAGVLRRIIGSHDALDVVVATAVNDRPQWLRQLRDHSELRIVLITDDRPDAAGPDGYLAQLAQTLGDSHRYSFNIIGGFEPPLPGQDGPVTTRCTGVTSDHRTLRGLDPGVVYQQLAAATGGARASLCSERSRSALIDAISGAAPPPVNVCLWPLEREARLFDARVFGPHGSEFLVREYSSSGCPGTRRSYVLNGPLFSLCPDTCEAVRKDGFEEVRARIECHP
jgi:hypothetical protein